MDRNECNSFSGKTWEFRLGSLVLIIGFNVCNELCAELYDETSSTQRDTYFELEPLPDNPININTGNSHFTDINNGYLVRLNNSAVLIGNITERFSPLVFSVILEMTPNHPCPNIQNGIRIVKNIPANDNSTYPADSGSKNIATQELYSYYPAESGLLMDVTAPVNSLKGNVLQGNEKLDPENSELNDTEFSFLNDSIPNNSNRPIYIVKPGGKYDKAESDGTVASFKKGTVSVGPKYEDLIPALAGIIPALAGIVSTDDKFSPAKLKGTFTDKYRNTGDFNLEIYWRAIF